MNRHGLNQNGPVLDSILNSLVERLRPQRLLVASAHPQSLPHIFAWPNSHIVRMDTGESAGPGDLVSRLEELPFEDGAFNMTIMHHVFCNGLEPALDEVQRVMAGNGQLVLIGRGRFGRNSDLEGLDVPYLDARAVCRRLRQRDFEIRQCEGIGCRGRTVHWHNRWQQFATPLNDQVLIRGQHKRERPVVTRLRFNQPQAAGVRSAAHEVLSRESVA